MLLFAVFKYYTCTNVTTINVCIAHVFFLPSHRKSKRYNTHSTNEVDSAKSYVTECVRLHMLRPLSPSITSYYLKSWLVPFGSWWTVKALLLHLHIYLNCRSKCRWQRCCFAAAVANRVKPFGKKRRVEQQAGQQRETNWKWQHRTSIVLLNRHILRGIIENYLVPTYVHYIFSIFTTLLFSSVLMYWNRRF